MTRGAKSKIWEKWVNRDDRKWLRKALSAELGLAADFVDSLHPYLISIVTAAKYGSHTPNPKATSKDFTQQVVLEECERFSRHLSQSEVLQSIDEKWHATTHDSHSLPLELSAEYLRFQVQTQLKRAGRHHGEHKTVALDDLSRQLVQSVDASISQIHDEDARLALELHFEGLVLSEIEALTGIPSSVASALIAMSKTHLKEELKEKWGT